MKVAAIAPRIISFHVDPVQRTFAGSAARTMPSRNAEESFDSGRIHLTPREREVLSLLCEGLPNKSIGRRLNISAGTVKIHVGKILSGLGVASRLQAVVIAHRQGLIDESDVSRDDDSYDAMPDKHLQRRELHPLRAA
jgi:DNA-binding NarL/FixJ family response regulator